MAYGEHQMRKNTWIYSVFIVIAVIGCAVIVQHTIKEHTSTVFSFQVQEITEIQVTNEYGESVRIREPDQIQEIVDNLNQFRAVRSDEVQSEGWDIGITLYNGEKMTGIITLTQNSVTVDGKVYYSALGEGFLRDWLEQLKAQIQ